MLATTGDRDKVNTTLSAFLTRESTPALLLAELERREVAPGQGTILRDCWIASGLVHSGLASFFDEAAGLGAKVIPFSNERVKQLTELAKSGDIVRGRDLFQSAKAGCAACHRVGQHGGVIGPDLTAVGGGVPADRLVTEVVWPARQVKDGYNLTKLVQRNGAVHQGYIEGGTEEGETLRIRDITGASSIEIPKDNVADRESIGSLMPPTAHSLNEEELADLLGYLFSLQGAE